jgi:uncharacterized membrane protein YkoI
LRFKEDAVRMKRTLAAAALLAAMTGCDKGIEDSTPIAVDKVPASVMEVAKKELPGVEFEKAWTGKAGGETAYEVRGTNEKGKTREVRISASGKVLEKE